MIRTLLFVSFLTAWSSGVWAVAPWLEDFDAAKKASAASGKPILVDVTGSDWCPPCRQMEAEVFSRPDFLPAATAKYVLLRLDFPRNTPQTERLRVQNKQLAERYPFEGFPTYMLMDSQGHLSGRHTGYLGGGVVAFLAMASKFEAQKSSLASLEEEVKSASPGTRAQAQDALFRQAEAWELTFQYSDLPMKIVQNADVPPELKARYQVYNAYNRLLGTWSDSADFHKAVDDLDQLADRSLPWPDLRQRILFTEGMVWWNALNDEIHARDAFRQVRTLGADTPTGQRAAELLDQLP